MTRPDEAMIEGFARIIHDRAVQEVEEQGVDMRSAVGRMWVEHLIEQGTVEEVNWCSLDVSGTKGVLVDGWSVQKGDDVNERRIQLFAVLETASASGADGNSLPVTTRKVAVDTAFKRMEQVLIILSEDRVLEQEDDPDVALMAQTIRDAFRVSKNTDVQLTVITDGTVTSTNVGLSPNLGAARRVLDLAWLQRTSQSGQEAVITFGNGRGVDCLVVERDEMDNPRILLAVIRGDNLAEIYGRNRERLLERNVRAYLQGKTKTNKAILRTIADEPHRFLSFNNGISATASSVEVAADGYRLMSAEGLQIVNGGQTTASLYNASRRRQHDQLQRVWVQAKITVVPQEELDHLVPRISESANSQNAIKASDLQANTPWEVELEKISREHRVAGPDGGETGWYYERGRGAYANMIAVQPSRAREWPADQVLTKADAALLEASWNGSPDLASKGPEAGFVVIARKRRDEETRKRQAGEAYKPSTADFERLVALATLKREVQRVVSEHTTKMKPPVVNYTIAWIGARRPGLLDVQEICRTGRLKASLVATLRSIVPLVDDVIKNCRPVTVVHEGEWPKKAACWHMVKDLEPGTPATPPVAPAPRKSSGQEVQLSDLERLAWIPLQHWHAAVRWSTRARKNNVYKDRLEKTIRDIQAGKGRDTEFARTALALYAEAMEQGFRPPELVKAR